MALLKTLLDPFITNLPTVYNGVSTCLIVQHLFVSLIAYFPRTRLMLPSARQYGMSNIPAGSISSVGMSIHCPSKS